MLPMKEAMAFGAVHVDVLARVAVGLAAMVASIVRPVVRTRVLNWLELMFMWRGLLCLLGW